MNQDVLLLFSSLICVLIMYYVIFIFPMVHRHIVFLIHLMSKPDLFQTLVYCISRLYR